MSKWFYGDNNILWGILIINSCMHGFQKLNCYNHVFKNDLQVLELDIKFVVVWKINFKCLKIGEILLQVFEFFSSTSILMWWTF